MVALRGLIYVGFAMLVVITWFIKRTPSHTANQSATASPDNETHIPTLHDKNWKSRLQAIAYIDYTQPETLPALIDLLSDKVPDVRQAASSALLFYGEQAIPALELTIKAGVLPACEVAVQTLQHITAPQTIPILIETLKNAESAWVRIAAATALGELGGDDATFALISALDDPHQGVVNAVESALHQSTQRQNLKDISQSKGQI